MTIKRILTLLFIVLLAVSLAACGGDDEPTATATPEPAVVAATNTPVPPPTNTPVPPTATSVPAAAQPTNTPEPASASNDFDVPSAVLDAFRTRGQFLITTTFEDGTSTAQDMALEGAFVKVDNAYGSDESFLMNIKESDSEESVAIYKIGDWVSAKSQDEWITVGRDNAGLFTAMPDIFIGFLDQFVLEREDATNLGDDPVNGQPATHYRIDDISIFQRMAQMGPDSEEVIESVLMDVWVAQDGNYILKYSVQAEVSNVTETDASGADAIATQAVSWSYEIYDVNGAVAITLPADAPAPGSVSVPGFADGEFPLPEGGQLAANMIGMPEVTSDLSQEELTAFYTETLTALGWTFSGDFGFYEVAKDGVSFALFIDTDDAGKGRAQVFADQ